MTEIKQSTITNAGRGVFATQHFKKGDFICFYDGVHIPAKNTFEYSDSHPYKLILPDGDIIIGYENSRTTNGVAQLINDGGIVNQAILLDVQNENELSYLLGDMLTYLKTSTSKQNVYNKGINCYANRDIDIGEELFQSYGISYWFSCCVKDISQQYIDFCKSNNLTVNITDMNTFLLYLITTVKVNFRNDSKINL
jgi:hypothetical protein